MKKTINLNSAGFVNLKWAGRTILLLLAFFTSFNEANAQVVLGTSSAKSATSGTIITLNHTTGTADNRLMLVTISVRGRLVSNVSYDGVYLELVGSELSSADAYTYIYQLKDPSSGIAEVQVNFSSSLGAGNEAIVGVYTFLNVDLLVNLNTKYFSASGNNGTPSINVNSKSGNLILDVVTIRDITLVSAGSSQTERLKLDTGGAVKGGVSTKAGAFSTSMSWNISGGISKWSMSAIDLTPVAVSDLSITNAVTNNTPYKNTNVVFTLTAKNWGPQNAGEVEVINLLPSGYVFVSSTASVGSYDLGSGLWNIGNLAINGTATLQITATVNGTGNYINNSIISGNVQDNNSVNNTSSVGVTVCKAGRLAPMFN